MLAKTDELYEMSLHQMEAFKIKDYTKPILILKVTDGWLYYWMEQVTFVPDQNINFYKEEQNEGLTA